MKSVGERIKETRTASGLSQFELATAVGIQTAGISKYEKGQVFPVPQDRLQKIASVLSVSVDYLTSELENTLYTLGYKVCHDPAGAVTVYDETEPDAFVAYSSAEWAELEQEWVSGFRTVTAAISSVKSKNEKPLAESDERLSEVKQTFIKKVKLLDDATVLALERLADQILSARG